MLKVSIKQNLIITIVSKNYVKIKTISEKTNHDRKRNRKYCGNKNEKKTFVEQTKALQAQHMLPRGVPKGVSMQFHLRGRDKKSGPFSLKEIC